MFLFLDIQEILAATGGRLIQSGTSGFAGSFTGVATDSRTIGVGELFVALKGERFDGNDFLAVSLERAAGAIISREPGEKTPLPAGKSIVLVPDTLKALQQMARRIRMKKPDMPVVGVTGSNGKTTTKELTACVLGARIGEVLKSRGNLNNQIGLPLNLCRLQPGHGAAVLEMGASRPGDIQELCDIAGPTHGIITNIGQSHLEGFPGGMEQIAGTKLALARAANTIIYNADDPLLRKAVEDEFRGQKQKTLISFGIREDAHLRACGIEMGQDGLCSSFWLSTGGPAVRARLAVPGLFNIYNALAAAAAGLSFGAGLEEAAGAFEEFHGVPMRYEIKETGGATLLNDVYNANPASMEEAVKELVRLRRNRAVAVLGDMLELGAHAEEAHRKLGARMDVLPVDVFIAVGPMMGLALEEFKEGRAGKFKKDRLAIACADSAQAARELMAHLRPGDTVLIKGSRGMKMEKVLPADGEENAL